MRVSYGKFSESLYMPKYDCQAEIFCCGHEKFFRYYKQIMYVRMVNWGLEVLK